MAQITIDLAKDILNGAGVTKNEIDQLCNFYLANFPRIVQLETELAKVTARYNFVRDMTPEQFENTSTIHEEFDRQIDAMIKEQQ